MSMIQRVETFAVAPRWLFVRIETHDGVVGWGEASLEGNTAPVRALVTQYADLLIGADETRIADLWLTTTRAGFYRGGPVMGSAVAGIDQALWDIAGKRVGLPVHRLLGGAVRDRIRVYSWIGGDAPSHVAEAAEAQMAAGMTAVKMNASAQLSPLPSRSEVSQIHQRVAAVRRTIGEDHDIAVDLHGRATIMAAQQIAAALEELNPMFIEEPVEPHHQFRLADLRTTIPIATGERLYNKEEFLGVLTGGVGVVQPDLAHAGGISEVIRIAALADCFGAAVAPHCPLGPIALAACLQVGFATSNHLIQEQSIGIHYNTTGEVLDYVADTAPLQFVRGHIERWEAPGLGIQIDESAVREADRHAPNWITPLWRHADGSFAEW
ncbi:MAG: galactonate dehydratase [Propionibacteriaceae bacterium]|jgi:galactonate dehydratase|nr:galactonate dehydratase [Propionibacteriaceae bacterium]